MRSMLNETSVPEAPAAYSPSDRAEALEPEWDEMFGWSYGRRVWNVGCG
jgi:hypothetical protein